MEGNKKIAFKIAKINREIEFLDKTPQPDTGTKAVIGELTFKKKKFSGKMNQKLKRPEPYKVKILNSSKV